MMHRYFILLAGGLLLGGCCLSGNCNAPVAAVPAGVATTSAPDGLGVALMDDEPAAGVPAKPRKTAQRNRSTVSETEASAASRSRGDTYEQQEAADRDDEARLKRKMIICQNCSASGQ